MSALNQDCTQVDRLVWKAREFEIGQRISYDVTVFNVTGSGSTQKRVRHEGVVLELWVEPWRDMQLAYAEVVTDDGREHRAWFHRDEVGAVGEFGKAPAGALF